MDIIILGGNSPHNKTWVRQLAKVLKPLAAHVIVHDYAHWDNQESEDINIDDELGAIEAQLANNSDYIIVAKSIGTVLTALGISEGTLKPKLCVLIGVPLRMIERHNIDYAAYFARAGCPLLFIQNSHDPLGSFAEIAAYLKNSSLREYQLVELPGDSHSYLDTVKLQELITGQLGAI